MDISQRQNGLVLLGKQDVQSLIEEFGSPLYVYEEQMLRKRCQEILSLCSLMNFEVYYSVKANTNINLLKIIASEGLHFDAISLGEINALTKAGIESSKIRFVSNNVKKEVMRQVFEKKICISIDSLCQLELYGSLNLGTSIHIRLNPPSGDGAHKKIITAGAAKFGVDWGLFEEALSIARHYRCKITGITSHIGSCFLDYQSYQRNVELMLEAAEKFPDLEVIDFGGGFGIPYKREEEQTFPLPEYAELFQKTLVEWQNNHSNRWVSFAVQPGRFIVGECAVCLGTIQSIKTNQGIDFIGTDIGFNVLMRPVLYDSYHEIINASRNTFIQKEVTFTGNICEGGDILGEKRQVPADTRIGDIILVRDTGAYGYSMSSNYNSFPRPAEVLITLEGRPKLIRRAEDVDSLCDNQVY